MDLQQLRYVRSVVRTGSVTAAAEQEHVAQPSISKQLRALEREIGTALFHRAGRRVVPTAAGLALADCAERMLTDLGETVMRIAGPEAETAQQLSLCATETVCDHLLPPALTALRERRPGARVSVEMLGTDDCVARVLADVVDLAIVVLPLAETRLEVTRLLQEEVLLAVPPGHRWARAGVASIEDALREPGLLLSMRGHGLRAQVDGAAARVGLALAAGIELRSQQALLAMVAAGGGVAFAPAMAMRGREDVAAVRLDPPMGREIGWVRRRGRHLPGIAGELLELATAGVRPVPRPG